MTRHELRPTFQTWTSEMAHHVGQTFTIFAMEWHEPEDHGGDFPEPMFWVRFDDNTEILAHAEEVFEGWIKTETEEQN
jgi:hypothetical protein